MVILLINSCLDFIICLRLLYINLYKNINNSESI